MDNSNVINGWGFFFGAHCRYLVAPIDCKDREPKLAGARWITGRGVIF